jgi:hypothetical protein
MNKAARVKNLMKVMSDQFSGAPAEAQDSNKAMSHSGNGSPPSGIMRMLDAGKRSRSSKLPSNVLCATAGWEDKSNPALGAPPE